MTAYVEKMWDKRNTPPLLVEVQTCTAALKISMAFTQGIGNQPTSRPSKITLGHKSKGCTLIAQGPLLNYVHNSIMHNSQNLKTT